MLTAFAILAAAQASDPQLKPVTTRLAIPKIAFLPTRSSYTSKEKYVGSQYAIEGADIGLPHPKTKPIPYLVVPAETFRAALVKAGMPEKGPWDLGAARAAAKAVGADYVAGVDLKSAAMTPDPQKPYVTVKADLTIFRLDAAGAKTKVVPLEATYYDKSTPTAREATYILGYDVVPRWFLKHRAELD